ncbi:MAG: hypothetical protein CMJ78_26855 [Planctomycetaceae bacterium]|nr:hypothetical protein [Planctomycetaceae bacterium]
MLSDFLKISDRIHVLPIIHGSGDFAIEVRRVMLGQEFDCLAVPLPPSFQHDVERAIDYLPTITAVLQQETTNYRTDDWSPEQDSFDDETVCSYVPVDPCQGVIAALRIAIQERMPRAFIDLETDSFQEISTILPDPYAVKKVNADKFAAAVLPALRRLPDGQPQARVIAMANRLRELEQQFESILLVCSVLEWPWIKEAYFDRTEQIVADDEVYETGIYGVDPITLIFMLGELPFVTGLYELARAELDEDDNLSVDAVKAVMLAARDRYQQELGNRARRITPKLLKTYFKYVRNLSLVEHRMTPDMYTQVVAAQQIFGDEYAIHLAETLRAYPYHREFGLDMLRMGNDEAQLPDGTITGMKCRLPGVPGSWRSCQLKPRPAKIDQDKWQSLWNPFRQCSWPEEDVAIEKFRTHVKDVALGILTSDFAQTEKFTTSIKDGLDIRETVRNWHTGEIYVRNFPPSMGTLDCVLMFFDSPADPRDYPWRTTWMAEHHDESTLALFATSFHEELVGPGIGLATYGGALFLFPPRPIPDVWTDPRLDFCDTLEERLLAGGCIHSQEHHIAILSDSPPGAAWRRLAKTYGKKLIHVPLSRFSQATIQQLRLFHVLNGHEVRSYAAHFIRKA